MFSHFPFLCTFYFFLLLPNLVLLPVPVLVPKPVLLPNLVSVPIPVSVTAGTSISTDTEIPVKIFALKSTDTEIPVSQWPLIPIPGGRRFRFLILFVFTVPPHAKQSKQYPYTQDNQGKDKIERRKKRCTGAMQRVYHFFSH